MPTIPPIFPYLPCPLISPLYLQSFTITFPFAPAVIFCSTLPIMPPPAPLEVTEQVDWIPDTVISEFLYPPYKIPTSPPTGSPLIVPLTLQSLMKSFAPAYVLALPIRAPPLVTFSKTAPLIWTFFIITSTFEDWELMTPKRPPFSLLVTLKLEIVCPFPSKLPQNGYLPLPMGVHT